MSLLLDTHVLLWWLGADDLEAEAIALIADRATLVAVSSASIWEASIKEALGKLETPSSLADAAVASGFEPLPISFEHAERAGALPAHHRDPFDRMLVAQAELEGLTLVTRDPAFEPYGVSLLRC